MGKRPNSNGPAPDAKSNGAVSHRTPILRPTATIALRPQAVRPRLGCSRMSSGSNLSQSVDRTLSNENEILNGNNDEKEKIFTQNTGSVPSQFNGISDSYQQKLSKSGDNQQQFSAFFPVARTTFNDGHSSSDVSMRSSSVNAQSIPAGFKAWPGAHNTGNQKQDRCTTGSTDSNRSVPFRMGQNTQPPHLQNSHFQLLNTLLPKFQPQKQQQQDNKLGGQQVSSFSKLMNQQMMFSPFQNPILTNQAQKSFFDSQNPAYQQPKTDNQNVAFRPKNDFATLLQLVARSKFGLVQIQQNQNNQTCRTERAFSETANMGQIIIPEKIQNSVHDDNLQKMMNPKFASDIKEKKKSDLDPPVEIVNAFNKNNHQHQQSPSDVECDSEGIDSITLNSDDQQIADAVSALNCSNNSDVGNISMIGSARNNPANESRKEKIQRFWHKKHQARSLSKKVRYRCRQNLAQQRFRHQGRFIKKELLDQLDPCEIYDPVTGCAPKPKPIFKIIKETRPGLLYESNPEDLVQKTKNLEESSYWMGDRNQQALIGERINDDEMHDEGDDEFYQGQNELIGIADQINLFTSELPLAPSTARTNPTFNNMSAITPTFDVQMSMGAGTEMSAPGSNLGGQQGYANLNQTIANVTLENKSKQLEGALNRQNIIAGLCAVNNKSCQMLNISQQSDQSQQIFSQQQRVKVERIMHTSAGVQSSQINDTEMHDPCDQAQEDNLGVMGPF